MLSFAIIILGLIVGSFLNVVIYRLPKAVIKQYKHPSQNHFLDSLSAISKPRSYAPCCKKQLAWFENIPLLSWILLQGQCRHCKKPISYRYPLIEILTATFFFLCFNKYGVNPEAFLWAIFFSYLVALCFIDLDFFLLPDLLTLSLCLLGLIASLLQLISVPIESALLGSVLGYSLPWSVNKIYYLWRKHDGFGGGDFKLLGSLGAWMGWQSVIPIISIASITALLATFLLMLYGKKISLKTQLPFGPFLILASIIIFLDIFHPLKAFTSL
jgi:leader peptidase (prepilin peptidase)/N-methyltransferase